MPRSRELLLSPALLDYCGARGRIPVAGALELDHRAYAFQPKHDGVYARISTDSRGAAVNVLGRNGAPLSDARELLGISTGIPDAVLHAELTAHTEAGIREREMLGYSVARLFDATRVAGIAVHREPYARRRALLFEHQVRAELARAGAADRDARGVWHDARSGRFACGPRDERRFPIVRQERGPGAAARLWRDHVEIGGGEGLVAVALEAPAGARRAKIKIKATDTLDCRVLEVGGGVARLAYRGIAFTTSARGEAHRNLRPGGVVEVACDGWYEASATPRFARIIRQRSDLR